MPKDACTTMPTTAVRYVWRTNRPSIAVGSEGDLAEGGGEQLLPKLPLDPDRVAMSAYSVVQGLEGGNVALVVRAVRSEVFGYRLARWGQR